MFCKVYYNNVKVPKLGTFSKHRHNITRTKIEGNKMIKPKPEPSK